MHIDKDLIAASATPLVLAILAEGESYGYAILKRVRALSAGELEWTDGMLYPLLHRLSRLGYVTTDWRTPPEGRRRKYYAITDEGRAALAEQQRQWLAVTRTLNDVWPGGCCCRRSGRPEPGGPGGADRGLAGLRRPRAGRQRPRRRRARGPSPPPDRRAERGGPHSGRGVPDRREAARRRRRPVPGVRARAQRPALEAAPRRRRGGTAAPAIGWIETLVFAVAAAVVVQIARLVAEAARRGADVAAAERQPLRAAVPRRLLRAPAPARRAGMAADGGTVRGSPRS